MHAVVRAVVAAAVAVGLAAGVDAGLTSGELVVKAGRHSHTLHSGSCHHSGLTSWRSVLTMQHSVGHTQSLAHWPLTAERQLKSWQADRNAKLENGRSRICAPLCIDPVTSSP